MRRELLSVLLLVGIARSAAAVPPCDFGDSAMGGGAASPPNCAAGDCGPEFICTLLLEASGDASGGGASASGECGCVPVSTSTPTVTPTHTATPTPTPTIPKMTGEPCTTPGECESQNCVDDFCCNTPCDGPGERCDRPASEGTCVGSTGAPAASPIGAGVVAIALLLLGIAALARIPWRRGQR